VDVKNPSQGNATERRDGQCSKHVCGDAYENSTTTAWDIQAGVKHALPLGAVNSKRCPSQAAADMKNYDLICDRGNSCLDVPACTNEKRGVVQHHAGLT
jgi:hypothetical protein